jgi:hypothetical protein
MKKQKTGQMGANRFCFVKTDVLFKHYSSKTGSSENQLGSDTRHGY